MTDVRAILEQQSRIRRRRAQWHNAFAVLCAISFVFVAIMYHFKGRSLMDASRLLFPLLFLNSAALFYSGRHIQALRDAIADPDPALDSHFAETLAMEREEVVNIGREAFLRRFNDRAPELDAAGWVNVAAGLRKAPTAEAEGLLRLLSAYAPAEAIERMEAFAESAKVERLQTATRKALGDLRLRVARQRVLGASNEANTQTQQEVARLGLTNDGLLATEPIRQS